jgi:enterochelin esterase-like enzyme
VPAAATWNNDGMNSRSEQQEWSRHRREVVEAKEQALRAAREA